MNQPIPHDPARVLCSSTEYEIFHNWNKNCITTKWCSPNSYGYIVGLFCTVQSVIFCLNIALRILCSLFYCWRYPCTSSQASALAYARRFIGSLSHQTTRTSTSLPSNNSLYTLLYLSTPPSLLFAPRNNSRQHARKQRG